MKQKIGFLAFALTIGLMAPVVFAAAPGSSPQEALRITNTWQTLAPHSSVWFYFDYTGDKSPIQVTLEDYGVANVRLSIFTPDQARQWLQDPTTPPIGIGTPPGDASAMRQYDLTWRGAFNFPGRFFVVVANDNPYAIQFRLNAQGDAVLLAPPPTATPVPTPLFATPVPVSNLQGRLVLQESSGGNIYTVNGDGTNLQRITWGIDPSWSPDGKHIAFTRWGAQAGVYVINADGSEERAFVGGIRQPLGPRWNPNGTKIAYTRQWGGSDTDSVVCLGQFCFTLPANPHWRLSTVDVNTQSVFDPRSSEHAFAPAWKNDNVTLVYADAGYGLMITNLNGDPEWNIYKLNPIVQTPMYSPDGKRIAFTARAHDHWDIHVLDLTNGNVIPVTRADPMAFRPANNVSPVWSPDGKQILFLSDRNGKWEFFVANWDGTNVLQVLKNVSDSLTITYNFSNERVIDWIK